MERKTIFTELNEIFSDVLEMESVVLTEETTAEDIEEWDSLNHIHIVVSIEKKFAIRFGSEEIQSWDTVGEIVDSIVEKTD